MNQHMHVLRSCLSHVITLFELCTLIFLLVPLADIGTSHVSVQLSAGTNTGPANTATDPDELLESIGSPENLMDSVLEEVRNTNTSETSVENGEEDSYSQGENMILSHQIIPAKDFIHIYNTYPFAIAEGLISAKLPCESDSSTHLKVMIGQIPRLQPANLSVEKDLSRPGYMCLYNIEIQQDSTSIRNMSSITDIVLFNTSNQRTILPNTSTFVMGVTKLYPIQNETIPAA
jgi:hypothetical protein